tara:strand:- start:494 stop:982 length:489 start_codon:yes stop_codon:yes gene_type:complete
MPRYEYKVVPAPAKGLKGKGIKGAEARFSHGLQELMNGLAGYGWEYQRAETLPSIERAGLTGTTTEWRNVLVFRRLREKDTEAFAPELLPAPAAMPPADEEVSAPLTQESEPAAEPALPQQDATPKADEPWDNGVEDTGNMNGLGPALTSLAAARESEKSKG